MLELFEILKREGIINFQVEFCKAIDIKPTTFNNILNKTSRPMHFTPEHIQNACKTWGIDANWFFGFSDAPAPSNIIRNIKEEMRAKQRG